MPANRLYHTWIDQIRQLCPQGRRTLIHNFAWLIIGIYLSHKVHLSIVANKIPGCAKLPGKVQRLRRLLMNKGICVRKWYDPVAEGLLRSQAQHGQIRLVFDSSQVSFHHQLLVVSMAYRRRAMPLVWTWVKHERGHSSAVKQLALLKHVYKLMPKNVSVLLVGDCEFGAVEILEQLAKWQWHYVLRQKGDTCIDLTLHNQWQRFDQVIDKPGQSLWLGKGYLTKQHVYPTNLLAHWKISEEEPWLLATNVPSLRKALQAYARRMWTEEMFGDFKGHGFALEDSHLCHFLRLSRLTLAVALLYVWLVTCGSSTIKNGKRSLVDRADRRDFSIFRIGYNIIERHLANSEPFSISLIPFF